MIRTQKRFAVSSAASVVALAATAVAAIPYFHYERAVNVPATSAQHYIVVDESIWQHARPSLSDIRLYDGEREVPYALGVETGGTEIKKQSIRILQPGTIGGKTQFLLDMSSLPEYDRVQLTVGARDFVARAAVEGQDDPHGSAWTKLGTTTIYDLSDEKLGHQSTLQVPLSTFKYLRVTIDGPVKPKEVQAASASSTREEKAVWRALNSPAAQTEKDKSSVFTFSVPNGVPVDRVTFDVDSTQPNFTRSVDIEQAKGTPVAFGDLSRIHMTRDGEKIDVENDSICICGSLPSFRLPDDDGANAASPGYAPAVPRERTITVIVHNGDDPPLKITGVKLEQRERRIYFDAAAGSHPSMYYADDKLDAPVYDYAKLFQRNASVDEATLGPEQANPAYKGRPDDRPWSEQHPAALWIAILAAVLVLGAVALRSLKTTTAK
jgi:hypothetical protein